MRYSIILARKNDNSSVFRYVCGEERLDSRLRWWFFGFGGGAATIWLRNGYRCLDGQYCPVGGGHNKEWRISLVLAVGFWSERNGRGKKMMLKLQGTYTIIANGWFVVAGKIGGDGMVHLS